MVHCPDPLGERLALMWHSHFATSNEKVRDFRAMIRQNALFREHARAPFGELLGRMAGDPALLVYLDAQANRKERPNENLARELMELFTLGVGHYTEADIKEAARALTGWEPGRPAENEVRAMMGPPLEQQWVRYSPRRHDDSEKTVFGRRERWSGEDLVKILLEQPATAERLAWRISTEFLGEGVATQAELSALAEGLRATRLDVGKAVARVLRSERFFADDSAGRRVPGPVEWAVAAARRFLSLDPPPRPLRLAEWAARMGQSLYYPPNVGGWPGGRAWLSPPLALLGRANLAADLVAGRLARPAGAPLDLLGLARRAARPELYRNPKRIGELGGDGRRPSVVPSVRSPPLVNAGRTWRRPLVPGRESSRTQRTGTPERRGVRVRRPRMFPAGGSARAAIPATSFPVPGAEVSSGSPRLRCGVARPSRTQGVRGKPARPSRTLACPPFCGPGAVRVGSIATGVASGRLRKASAGRRTHLPDVAQHQRHPHVQQPQQRVLRAGSEARLVHWSVARFHRKPTSVGLLHPLVRRWLQRPAEGIHQRFPPMPASFAATVTARDAYGEPRLPPRGIGHRVPPPAALLPGGEDTTARGTPRVVGRQSSQPLDRREASPVHAHQLRRVASSTGAIVTASAPSAVTWWRPLASSCKAGRYSRTIVTT